MRDWSMSNQIISIERQQRKSGGPRKVLILKCFTCDNTIKVRSGEFTKKEKHLCKVCSHIKLPYESIFNSLKNDWRKVGFSLTYEDFIELVKITKCHYCYSEIERVPYATVEGKYKSRAYFLDRKDNDKGYSVENCVVCCTKCNRARSDKYTYEEWYEMNKYFRDKY